MYEKRVQRSLSTMLWYLGWECCRYCMRRAMAPDAAHEYARSRSVQGDKDVFFGSIAVCVDFICLSYLSILFRRVCQ